MFKRALSIIATVVIILCCVPVTNAAVIPENDTVQPMYTYTSSHNTSIYVSGSTVTCKASLAGKSNVTKIYITMTLQKKTLLWWNDVEEWVIIHTDTTSGNLTRSLAVDSGTYRVKAEYRVFSGTASETITDYSAEKSV